MRNCKFAPLWFCIASHLSERYLIGFVLKSHVGQTVFEEQVLRTVEDCFFMPKAIPGICSNMGHFGPRQEKVTLLTESTKPM
uniref:Secreted protein n=1 Tax=Steinernema glaseri TaxID=37863 RepID=A0A1I8AUS4_9BILA